jgi:hypothetical protein
MKFNLDPSDKTFVELKTGQYPWWENLKENKDISIQIRKENRIDVYYNGGAILRELVYDEKKKEFSADIHPKYIPLEKDNEYMTLVLTNTDMKITNSFEPMGFSNFEDDKLKKIIARVKKYHPSKSEKAIQFDIATSDHRIIDAEFQIGKSRVDLVRLDMDSKKIVFIEIKTISDARLLSDPDEDKKNIFHQLEKYRDFVNANQKALLEYYGKVLQIKNDLGIAKPPIKGLMLNEWQIEPRPLLAFGDCTQKWIDTYAKSIDKNIKSVAYGAYYFGDSKPSLDLVPKSKENRHVFKHRDFE